MFLSSLPTKSWIITYLKMVLILCNVWTREVIIIRRMAFSSCYTDHKKIELHFPENLGGRLGNGNWQPWNWFSWHLLLLWICCLILWFFETDLFCHLQYLNFGLPLGIFSDYFSSNFALFFLMSNWFLFLFPSS